MRAFVIAVSGVPGCGAAGLCDELGRYLERSAVLHFKDYLVSKQPGSVWLRGEDNFDALDFSDMKRDAVRLAEDRRCDCVIVDIPVGRGSASALEFIDFVFYLECPLDVALAKWVGQRARTMPREEMRKNMRLYVEQGGEIARKIDRVTRRESDVRIHYSDLSDVEDTLKNYAKTVMINLYTMLTFTEANRLLNSNPFAREKKSQYANARRRPQDNTDTISVRHCLE